MAWNGFPAIFRAAILRKLKPKHNSNDQAPYSNTSSENNFSNNIADEIISKIWVRIPFLGKQGEVGQKTNPQNTTQPYLAGEIYRHLPNKKGLLFSIQKGQNSRLRGI